MHVERLPRGAVWAGLAGSIAVHVGAVVLLLLSMAETRRAGPPMYAVELIAAPASTASRPAASARSAPVPPPPPAPAAVPRRTPSKAPTTTARAPAARTTAPVTPLPGETPGTGTDLANVDLKGKQFPYPEYLRNLVEQIYRRWSRPSGNASLTTEVGFVILRDGTVRDIAMVNSSRSYSFDLEARGAIEAAARDKAFGPLPAGYEADYLQINFLFTPRRNP